MICAIVGGSGGFGQGLGERLEQAGETVLYGSRRPREDFLPNEEVCRRAEVVFFSVPPDGCAAMARELAADLAGRIVVSVAAPVVFRDGRPGAAPGEVSIAELVARAAPGARVVAGFHTVSAKALADSSHPLDEDVLLAGDDEDAKEVVAGLARKVVDGRAVDCGRLEVARWIEPITAVILNVNRRYRTNAGIRVTGVE